MKDAGACRAGGMGNETDGVLTRSLILSLSRSPSYHTGALEDCASRT